MIEVDPTLFIFISLAMDGIFLYWIGEDEFDGFVKTGYLMKLFVITALTLLGVRLATLLLDAIPVHEFVTLIVFLLLLNFVIQTYDIAMKLNIY